MLAAPIGMRNHDVAAGSFMVCNGCSVCSGSMRPENNHAFIASVAALSGSSRSSIAGTSPPNVMMAMGGIGMSGPDDVVHRDRRLHGVEVRRQVIAVITDGAAAAARTAARTRTIQRTADRYEVVLLGEEPTATELQAAAAGAVDVAIEPATHRGTAADIDTDIDIDVATETRRPRLRLAAHCTHGVGNDRTDAPGAAIETAWHAPAQVGH